MTSEHEMSLRVDCTSSSSLLSQASIDRVLRGPLYVDHNMSTNMDSEDFGSRNAMEGVPVEQSSSSIVGASQPAQNSHEWENLLDATTFSAHSLHNFSEHRKLDSTINPKKSSFEELHQTSLGEVQQTPLGGQHQQQSSVVQELQSSSATTTTATAEPSRFITSGDTSSSSNPHEPFSWGTREFATTHSEYSQHGGISKPADSFEDDPEQALGFLTRRRPHESPHAQHNHHPPQLTSLATLVHSIQPPVQQHTATAAEIALGITSSYSQWPDYHISAMGDGSRTHNTQEVESRQRGSGSIDNIWFQGKDDEEHTSRTSDTFITSSPGRMTPLHDSSEHGTSDHPRVGMVVGTPSTVSTAPSTDDASLGTDYRLDESMLPNLLHPLGHRRSQSWGEDALLLDAGLGTPEENQAIESYPSQNPWIQSSNIRSPAPLSQPHHVTRRSWGGIHGIVPMQQFQQQHLLPQSHQRIASFRNEGAWEQQMPLQHVQDSMAAPSHDRYPPQQFGAYQEHLQGQPQQPHEPPQGGVRIQAYAQQHSLGHHAPASTLSPVSGPPPLRNPRQPRQLGPRQAITGTPGVTQNQPASVSQRSASEVLKTLLRKKACLYEPDTSRSVALVTWLVGRELAHVYGFFSRQQLQSGVHACVASKIEAGTITRTKVNRCMQIILNSCFHYIIPRSDGTEENGDHFRDIFSKNVNDDSYLLRHLPEPWNDLTVQRDAVIEATLHEMEEDKPQGTKSPSTPKTSPRFGSVNADKSPDRDFNDGVDRDDSKRAVLLCFNENVRSAEDVFRCHNEFIRDTANAAHLQLTAQEWRQFFGREASGAPYLWGNVGIPTLTGETPGGPPRQPDLLGQMSKEELAKFRTSWCTKRYDHDRDLCGFAHVEVNGGWLRRNSAIYEYKDEMCPLISTAGDKFISPSHFFLNECPKGVHCRYAHSMEEILYHSRRYKTKVCTSLYSRSGGCHLGDVCPDLHPPDVTRPLKKSSESRSHSNRRKHEHGSHLGTKPCSEMPAGSPVVYASPAPFSSFEHQLGMPGLQSLYRRHSEVIRAFVRSSGKAKCSYSPFGDGWGISDASSPSSTVSTPKQSRP